LEECAVLLKELGALEKRSGNNSVTVKAFVPLKVIGIQQAI
jgi:hypothetical protein